jgi:hypothetical protein
MRERLMSDRFWLGLQMDFYLEETQRLVGERIERQIGRRDFNT